jgi:ABC-2 type transport system ATP-binding protein
MSAPAVEVRGLRKSYGRVEAVNGLDLTVRPGRCYGLFGRNGAGKTTTMKCLLHLLRPAAGSVRVCGLDPARDEVGVKSRVGYVPDTVAFYPWMTVRDTLDYLASFRRSWNAATERDLLERFDLDPTRKVTALSKGQRTQLALVGAIAPEPELLLLDEPTSGLDPIVRRGFVQTVIGAYQGGEDGRRTILVSTHLISEFEGLIDEFTIIDRGRAVLSLEADTARARFQKLRARFPGEAPALDLPPGALQVRREGRELDLLVEGGADDVRARLAAHAPECVQSESLSLEEIFIASPHLREH